MPPAALFHRPATIVDAVNAAIVRPVAPPASAALCPIDPAIRPVPPAFAIATTFHTRPAWHSILCDLWPSRSPARVPAIVHEPAAIPAQSAPVFRRARLSHPPRATRSMLVVRPSSPIPPDRQRPLQSLCSGWPCRGRASPSRGGTRDHQRRKAHRDGRRPANPAPRPDHGSVPGIGLPQMPPRQSSFRARPWSAVAVFRSPPSATSPASRRVPPRRKPSQSSSAQIVVHDGWRQRVERRPGLFQFRESPAIVRHRSPAAARPAGIPPPTIRRRGMRPDLRSQSHRVGWVTWT